GLEEDDAKALDVVVGLLPVGKHKNVARPVVVGQTILRHVPSKLDEPCDALLGRQRAKRGVLLAAAGDQIAHVRYHALQHGERFDDGVVPFAFLQPSDSQDHLVPVESQPFANWCRAAGWAEAIGVDTGTNDDNSRVRNACLPQETARVLAIGDHESGVTIDATHQDGELAGGPNAAPLLTERTNAI